jgi:5-methylcytosine-specific restriction endonuclease McrA
MKRLPPDWARRRIRVLRRDAYICQRCGAPATHVDHIIAGDNHELWNLQALCEPCHNRKTSQEGNAARNRYPTKRQPESHPGLIGGGTLKDYMDMARGFTRDDHRNLG